MDTTDYDNEIFSLLKDKTTYKTTTHDPNYEFNSNLINELEQLKQNGKSHHNYTIDFSPVVVSVKNSTFYLK